MRKSPGRVARPICLIMALALFVTTVLFLAVGATQRGEQATIGLQMAVPLALLAILWILIGIMFTLARPGQPNGPVQPAQQQSAPPAEPKINWFHDGTTGSVRRSGARRRVSVPASD